MSRKQKKFKSFVGLHPVPIVHGMTAGEYALMVNGENWLSNNLKCDLHIIKVKNYTHSDIVEIPIKPSPNLPTLNSILLYPSLCLFEGTKVSIGRGTDTPFELLGHPLYKSAFSFTPVSKPGASMNPPLKNKKCYGVDLSGFYLNNTEYLGKINLEWIITFYKDLNNDIDFFINYFEKLAGTGDLREQIKSGLSEKKIRRNWAKDLKNYKQIRTKYLLYQDF